MQNSAKVNAVQPAPFGAADAPHPATRQTPEYKTIHNIHYATLGLGCFGGFLPFSLRPCFVMKPVRQDSVIKPRNDFLIFYFLIRF
jgi:hypothetical protein